MMYDVFLENKRGDAPFDPPPPPPPPPSYAPGVKINM